MLIKQAMILSKGRKADDELKAIMATHPWGAPGMIHGFYKSSEEEWEPDLWSHRRPPDAIWVDEGITRHDHENKWLVESFHMPDLCRCRPLPADPLGAHDRRKGDLESRWWNATVALVLHQIPSGYHVHSVYYGEIEDDADPETTWRDAILAHFDYSKEVKAALGSAKT